MAEEKRLSKARDFKKLLSDSLGVTSKFFKSLLRRAAGGEEDEFNPFAKGALSFDDYSYKYFNDVVLNPKALKSINEEAEDLIFGAHGSSTNIGKQKGGAESVKPEDDSNLTLDQIREFEGTSAKDPEGDDAIAALPLGDFLPKEVVSKMASSTSVNKPSHAQAPQLAENQAAATDPN
jgi:hypothetical protein